MPADPTPPDADATPTVPVGIFECRGGGRRFLRREDMTVAQADDWSRARVTGTERAIPLTEAQVAQYAPAPPPAAPKTAGLSQRRTWTFRIHDEALIPRQYLMVDEVKLRKYVVAMGAQANVPGVQVYQQTSEAVRSRG